MRWIWIAVAIGATVAMGCSKKGSECEQFNNTANPSVDKLNKASALPDDKPEQAMAQAQEVQKIADETVANLTKLTFTVPELQKMSADYQSTLKDMSASSKALIELVKSLDTITKKAEKLPEEMKQAGDKLTAACAEDKEGDDADECKKIAEKVQNLPSDPSKGAEVIAFAAELEKMTLKNAATKAVAVDIAKTFKDLGKLMTDLEGIGPKAQAASKKEEEAISKQNAVVDSLNKFCSQ